MRKTVVVDDGVSNLPLESTQSPFLMTLSDSLFSSEKLELKTSLNDFCNDETTIFLFKIFICFKNNSNNASTFYLFKN